MSDLISRSELIKHFEAIQQQENVVGLEFIAMIDEIKEQPTAYDIDKVVVELNELDVTAIRRYEGGTFGNYEGTDYYIKKSKAIEIVKQGGVSDSSDYVCEWRIVDRPHNLPIYNTSCGKIRLQYTTGVDIYCNGCGNKIKVKQNDN